MELATKVVLLYLVVVSLSWLIRHRFVTLSVKRLKQLSSDYKFPEDINYPRVSIIVAARNEEENIRNCIESLLKQDYPDFEVIAVDDRSEDSTGRILDELGSIYPDKLKVVHIDKLPEGWYGKHYAMYTASRIASGKYLLFTDADCIFVCPMTVKIAVAHAIRNNIDLLTVLPKIELVNLWEKIFQPACSIILLTWFRPERANRSWRKTAYANGAFMLFSRIAYDAVGGHKAVRDKLCEDMALARLIKATSLKLYVIHNKDLYKTRMYKTPLEAVRGWSRIFFGSFERLWFVLLAMGLLIVMSIMPYFILLWVFVYGCINGWVLPYSVSLTGILSVVAIASQLSVIARLYLLFGLSWYYSISYPLASLFALLVFINTVLRFFVGKVEWKGVLKLQR